MRITPTVALVDPEIPPNTGNVARTCVATRTPLCLIGQLGFSLDDYQLRRAGLDYFEDLALTYLPDFCDLERIRRGRRLVLTSAHGAAPYHTFAYRPDDILVFGAETSGLPRDLLDCGRHPVIRVPTWGPVRSLNLGNVVAVVLYQLHASTGSFPATPEPSAP